MLARWLLFVIRLYWLMAFFSMLSVLSCPRCSLCCLAILSVRNTSVTPLIDPARKISWFSFIVNCQCSSLLKPLSKISMPSVNPRSFSWGSYRFSNVRTTCIAVSPRAFASPSGGLGASNVNPLRLPLSRFLSLARSSGSSSSSSTTPCFSSV